jgi:hypothetical protein
VRTLLHPFALAALVTLSVTGGAAYAQTATVSQEHGLDYRPPGDLWQTAGQAQERDRSVLGSAEPIPEPTPPLSHRSPRSATAAATPWSPPPPCSSRWAPSRSDGGWAAGPRAVGPSRPRNGDMVVDQVGPRRPVVRTSWPSVASRWVAGSA